jgi:MoxR-like ATPase
MKNKIIQLKQEISKQIIGQKDMVDALLIGLFTNGHILLEGVPGLAKTTAVKAMAQSLNLDFKRVQFTPDLIPSDILGAQIYDMKTGEFKIKKGAVFTNLLLADEINRAPAKVQSALLEVMQEYQATIANKSYKVDKPFLVLATQNPIEEEGAYKLPEAQLDRFMFKIIINYNTKEEELLIARNVASNSFKPINSVVSFDEIIKIQNEILDIHMDKEIEQYIVNIIDASRYPKQYNLNHLEQYIAFGASPRATIDMFKASKAQAYLRNNNYVTPTDIALIAKDILRHRIILSYEAQADDIKEDCIIDQILQNVDIP